MYAASRPVQQTCLKGAHTDSEKKAKKDSGKIFQLVGPLLEEILPCFDRESRDVREPNAFQKGCRDILETLLA